MEITNHILYMPKPVQQNKEVKEAKAAKQASVAATRSEARVQEEEEVKNITCSEFQSNRVFFKSTELKPKSSQITCFLKYQYNDTTKKLNRGNNDGEKLLMVTKPIKIVRGGIPRHNSQYHGADENSTKRAYFYIPKNLEDPNSMELFDAIDRFDDYMEEEINTKKNANGILCYKGTNGNDVKCKGITYVRMVSTAQPQTLGDEEGGKAFIPWDRIKVKLSTVFDDKLGPDDRKEINTQVYVETNEKPEKISTITDIEKYFKWNCTAQFALDFNKAWVMTNKEKKCSIGIKCVQIGVTELSDVKSSVSKQINKKLFGGSGPSTKVDPKKTTKKNQKDSEQEQDEEQGDDAEGDVDGEDEGDAEGDEGDEGEGEGEGDEADAEADAEGDEGDGEGDEADADGEGDEADADADADESEPEPEPEPKKNSKKNLKKTQEEEPEEETQKKKPLPVKVAVKNGLKVGSKTVPVKKR